MPNHPFCEEILSDVQPKTPLSQLKTVPSSCRWFPGAELVTTWLHPPVGSHRKGFVHIPPHTRRKHRPAPRLPRYRLRQGAGASPALGPRVPERSRPSGTGREGNGTGRTARDGTASERTSSGPPSVRRPGLLWAGPGRAARGRLLESATPQYPAHSLAPRSDSAPPANHKQVYSGRQPVPRLQAPACIGVNTWEFLQIRDL